MFAHADPAEAREVFQWHRGFAGANDMLFPRSWNQYEQLANDGRVFTAKEDGEYLGLCYYNWDEDDEDDKFWELGGLMVATNTRGRSIGITLMRVTLAQLLFDEEPLSRHEAIISHVHSQNDNPRRVIETHLGFPHQRQIEIPGAVVPGLRQDEDGMVRGDVFAFAYPYTLEKLLVWCETWDGRLRDGSPAEIQIFGDGIEIWAAAFRQMLADPMGI
ncbi:hypothetical protein AWB94_30975 [Mycolicibacterium canariasense]|nr:hypothetical protein AWB94_30975 [Mycolicibacterium canariasense]